MLDQLLVIECRRPENAVHSSGTLHAPGCSDDRCAEFYGTAFGEARFQCPRCDRWVGYCMGAHDEMPALCDDCFCFILEAPDADRTD